MFYSIENFIGLILFIILAIAWVLNRAALGSFLSVSTTEGGLRTEQLRLEQKIKDQEKELAVLHQEKLAQLYRFAEFGKISSGIFHDLINPLTAISLNINQLDPANLQIIETKKYIQRALAASTQTQKIICALQNQLSFQNTNILFSPQKELENVLLLLGYKARRAEVHLQTKIKKVSELFGNPIRFQQIIANLISNAIDAYDGKNSFSKKVIYISLSSYYSHLRVTIKDFGTGIPLSLVSKIFDPFFTTKAHYKGMGLGLSSTKTFIEKDFNGNISIESVAGIGTKFIVELPYLPSPK
ncbi:MAG: HAMP domain-containing sensor histidine kinase [Patescibacteria group bacterium]